MGGPDHGEHYALTPGPDMVKAVLNHASASKGGFGKGADVIVAVVDIRRVYTHFELPDYCDARTRARKCGKLKWCLYGTGQAARAWQREFTFRSGCEVGRDDARI